MAILGGSCFHSLPVSIPMCGVVLFRDSDVQRLSKGFTRCPSENLFRAMIPQSQAPAGEVAGIAAILQDVTKRWEREKEPRDRLAAAEVQLQITSSDR